MTQIISISANTAAYAAQVLKPSARVSGQMAVDDTMLTPEAKMKEAKMDTPLSQALIAAPASMALSLMGGNGRLPQGTRYQARARYMEAAGERLTKEESDQQDRRTAT